MPLIHIKSYSICDVFCLYIKQAHITINLMLVTFTHANLLCIHNVHTAARLRSSAAYGGPLSICYDACIVYFIWCLVGKDALKLRHSNGGYGGKDDDAINRAERLDRPTDQPMLHRHYSYSWNTYAGRTAHACMQTNTREQIRQFCCWNKRIYFINKVKIMKTIFACICACVYHCFICIHNIMSLHLCRVLARVSPCICFAWIWVNRRGRIACPGRHCSEEANWIWYMT